MATTNYYTFDRSIVAENQPGGTGYRTYGGDALGSVSTTYDDTGALQDSFRYSPYGQTILSNGTISAPAFQWVGRLGYRSTGRQFYEHYVRSRHFSSLGVWSSRDLMWPSQPAFVYSSCSPATRVDPSGLACWDAQLSTSNISCEGSNGLVPWGPQTYQSQLPIVPLLSCGKMPHNTTFFLSIIYTATVVLSRGDHGSNNIIAFDDVKVLCGGQSVGVGICDFLQKKNPITVSVGIGVAALEWNMETVQDNFSIQLLDMLESVVAGFIGAPPIPKAITMVSCKAPVMLKAYGYQSIDLTAAAPSQAVPGPTPLPNNSGTGCEGNQITAGEGCTSHGHTIYA